MKHRTIVSVAVFSITFWIAGVAPLPVGATSAKDPAVIWTASDGNGAVELFWYPLAGWPGGGFRLERLSDTSVEVVADRIVPGNEAGIALVDAPLRDEVRRLAESLAAGDKSTAASAFLRTAVEPAIGYALGLRAMDREGSAERRYRLSGLAANGRPGWSVETAPVDPRQASPRLGPAPELAGEQSAEGISLTWRPPAAAEGGAQAFSFTVQRTSESGTVELTPEPLIALRPEGDRVAGFLDSEPPAGIEVTYRVTLRDVFGRTGVPAEVKLFVEDLAALEPPAGLAVAAEPGRLVLTWEAKETRGTGGYRLERALYHQGPYEPRLEQPLGREVTRFADDDVRGGTAYHYRLRSLDRRGVEGEPSLVASAIARATSAPKRPQGLTAEAGRTRVRLRWQPAGDPIAGFLVERKTPAGTWARLNAELGVEALFDDRVGPQDGGRLAYRVIAVAIDSQLSEPSSELEVELPDSVPPPRPTLLSVSSDREGVTGEFLPGAPYESSTEFLVLRGGAFDDPGLVVGEALGGSARSFSDRFVRAGNDYWYRLVAIDAGGRQSEPSDPLRVRVPVVGVPSPGPPRLEVLEPSGMVRLSFEEPPVELSTWIERRVGDQSDWLTIAGPVAGSIAVDVRPERKGDSEYRIVYRSANGVSGTPSEPAVLVPTRR